MAKRILTLHELNHATLARQSLLERTSSLSPLASIKHLVAMQGQVSNAPYIGLWTRLHTFQRDELTRLLENRQVVRAPSLRGTLHILAAEDYLLFHPLLLPIFARNLHIFTRQAGDFPMEQFVNEMRAYIRQKSPIRVELLAKMEEFYPGMGKQQLADAVRMHMALIQPTPAGTWDFTGKPTYTEASAWLGRPLAEPETGLHELILRYLAAFGPASVQDMQQWSGLTRLKPVFDILRPQLLTFQDERGRELFDLPDAPRPSADTPVPVRFLPDFDNILFAYDDRRRVMTDEVRSAVFVDNRTCTTFLVDGFVRGTWKVERGPTFQTLVVIPLLGPLSPQAQSALREEGERLMSWMFDDTQPYKIQFSENT
jgi:DNA glycosylase AlkZ-like